MPYRPNALDSATVRQIRIAHLIDGESCKSITRRTGVSVACVSRLCRLLSQSESDQDLRYLPRPIHRGGGSRAGTEAYEQEKANALLAAGQSCRQCIHITDNGTCGIGFSECLTSNYQEASKCNVFSHA